jgi:hypothetical protein
VRPLLDDVARRPDHYGKELVDAAELLRNGQPLTREERTELLFKFSARTKDKPIEHRPKTKKNEDDMDPPEDGDDSTFEEQDFGPLITII